MQKALLAFRVCHPFALDSVSRANLGRQRWSDFVIISYIVCDLDHEGAPGLLYGDLEGEGNGETQSPGSKGREQINSIDLAFTVFASNSFLFRRPDLSILSDDTSCQETVNMRFTSLLPVAAAALIFGVASAADPAWDVPPPCAVSAQM